MRSFEAVYEKIYDFNRKFTIKCKIFRFGHFFIVNMTFLGAQHLAWVGPPTATAKQQPGLKSSQNCASLRMHSADFTVIVNSSPHLAPFS